MFVSWEKNLAYDRDFESRGMRVANFIRIIINQINEKIGGSDYVFMVEDDTRAPVKAFEKLWRTMEYEKNLAYISGIECGRGFTKHTGICRLIKDESGEIIGREIPKMKESGIVEIGGGGWYCWIGRSDMLNEYIEKGKMRCFDGKMLGPDVMMIHDMREMGMDCLCDLSVQCDHYDDKRSVWLPASTGKGYDIRYYLDDGKWKMLLDEKV